jgi:hypothetical protein
VQARCVRAEDLALHVVRERGVGVALLCFLAQRERAERFDLVLR